MDRVLASHHLPVILHLDIPIPKRAGQPGLHEFDAMILENNFVRTKYREIVGSEMERLHADHFSTNDMPASMRVCYAKVAAECSPKLSRNACKPWVSNIILKLISDQDAATEQNNTITKWKNNCGRTGKMHYGHDGSTTCLLRRILEIDTESKGKTL